MTNPGGFRRPLLEVLYNIVHVVFVWKNCNINCLFFKKWELGYYVFTCYWPGVDFKPSLIDSRKKIVLIFIDGFSKFFFSSDSSGHAESVKVQYSSLGDFYKVLKAAQLWTTNLIYKIGFCTSTNSLCPKPNSA